MRHVRSCSVVTTPTQSHRSLHLAGCQIQLPGEAGHPNAVGKRAHLQGESLSGRDPPAPAHDRLSHRNRNSGAGSRQSGRQRTPLRPLFLRFESQGMIHILINAREETKIFENNRQVCGSLTIWRRETEVAQTADWRKRWATGNLAGIALGE